MKKIIVATVLLLAGYMVLAQHQEVSEKPEEYPQWLDYIFHLLPLKIV